jgi:hypothetical protein
MVEILHTNIACLCPGSNLLLLNACSPFLFLFGSDGCAPHDNPTANLPNRVAATVHLLPTFLSSIRQLALGMPCFVLRRPRPKSDLAGFSTNFTPGITDSLVLLRQAMSDFLSNLNVRLKVCPCQAVSVLGLDNAMFRGCP